MLAWNGVPEPPTEGKTVSGTVFRSQTDSQGPQRGPQKTVPDTVSWAAYFPAVFATGGVRGSSLRFGAGLLSSKYHSSSLLSCPPATRILPSGVTAAE